MTRLLSLLVVLSMLAVAVSADAQKRRRRSKRQRQPPTQQEQPPAPPAEAAPATEAAPGSDMVIEVEETDAAPAPVEPAASPAPAEPVEQAQDATTAELQALRQELASVMDRLVQTRARVSMLGKSLFKTRVRIKLRNEAGPDPIASKIVVLLDGAPVFSGDGSSLDADGYRQLFDGFAAPGPHVLTLELEQRARDDENYRYQLRESFHFIAPRERISELTLVVDDDSDMADEFPDDQEGEYEVSTRLEVQARELDAD